MKTSLLVGQSPLDMIPRVLDEIVGSRILDVGCGVGVYGFMLRHRWQDTPIGFRQVREYDRRDPRLDEPELLSGCDLTVHNLRRTSHHRSYDELALASADALPYPDDYVDTVLCIEVLEHLDKPAALRALRDFERIARKRIVITVPRESLDPHTGHDERPFLRLDTPDPDVQAWTFAETHRSAFTPSELRSLGFRCGRKVEPGPRAPLQLAMALWQTYGPPGGQLLAVKDLDKPERTNRGALPPPPATTEGFPDYRPAERRPAHTPAAEVG
ncbi:methyltransferase domain-containing protein [Polyangium sorediatum]|uniref:Class I SAM-dependent methyltransferase n=1 Tax=Polyangium sorediatum TaxID=889274 RepID=A0ABT6NXU7_9BACT|nr:class I SAM-dependent methyltransferase [Polyangium sorediatum]MDI1433177.1 class I SAM-dependent methyltransferase [Polyangium sorediatum]